MERVLIRDGGTIVVVGSPARRLRIGRISGGPSHLGTRATEGAVIQFPGVGECLGERPTGSAW